PFRTTFPYQTLARRCPSPSTSVRNRYAGPSSASAAYVTGSFSFDAGSSEVSASRAKRVAPLSRSRTTPADDPERSAGAASARSSWPSRVGAVAPARAAEHREIHTAAAATSALTPTAGIVPGHVATGNG